MAEYEYSASEHAHNKTTVYETRLYKERGMSNENEPFEEVRTTVSGVGGGSAIPGYRRPCRRLPKGSSGRSDGRYQRPASVRAVPVAILVV